MKDEPIFNSILSNMVLGLAVNLKKKARIKVKQSCALIGVIDENCVLEEGEIFLQINRSSYEEDLVVKKLEEEL